MYDYCLEHHPDLVLPLGSSNDDPSQPRTTNSHHSPTSGHGTNNTDSEGEWKAAKDCYHRKGERLCTHADT